jgi:uncharacterized protein YuzE
MNSEILKLEYDKEADAAYINLTQMIKPGEVEDTIMLGQEDDRVKTMINLDFDKDGRLLGLEVMDASKVLRSDLLFSKKDGSIN